MTLYNPDALAFFWVFTLLALVVGMRASIVGGRGLFIASSFAIILAGLNLFAAFRH